MLGQLQHRGLRLHSTALLHGHCSPPTGRQSICTAGALSAVRGSNTLGRRVSPGLSHGAVGHPHKEVPTVRGEAPSAARATGGATHPSIKVEPASPSPKLPKRSGLERLGHLRQLSLRFPLDGVRVVLGNTVAGDFPDSPDDGWATALAYRQHVERVVARLREDPDTEVQVAAVDDKGRRLHAWAPGDESVRPSVLAAIRAALGLGPRMHRGRRRQTNPDLPEGSGLTRGPAGLAMYKTVQRHPVRVGTVAAGDFPDSPGDGWATALAYRQHVERVVARLREDPDAEVQVAEVGKHGRRLRAWAPGDESVRQKVLAAIGRALRQ